MNLRKNSHKKVSHNYPKGTGKTPPQYCCDEKGYLAFSKGLKILNYRLYRQLGKGTFSKVFAVHDTQTTDLRALALKVIRNTEKYQVAARTELKILEFITEVDKDKSSCCIHLLDSFFYYGHPCFVFPLFGRSLYSFMHDNQYRPFLDQHILDFARQIINAINFLHSFRIVFTDLKPENIVFVKDHPIRSKIGDTETWIPSDTQIKLVDFGSAVWDSKDHNYLIQTRHYRAPEVVLGMNWSIPVDTWSIGCVLLELTHGQMVYNTHDSIDHLNQMITMIGAIPRSLIYRIPADTWEAFFHSDGSLRLEIAKRSCVQCKPLAKYFKSSPQHELLMDVIARMLRWKAEDRISTQKALEHRYFKDHQ
jgi:serine/threonine protein kinase